MSLKWEKVKFGHPSKKPMKGGSTAFIEVTVKKPGNFPRV